MNVVVLWLGSNTRSFRWYLNKQDHRFVGPTMSLLVCHYEKEYQHYNRSKTKQEIETFQQNNKTRANLQNMMATVETASVKVKFGNGSY